MKRCLNCKFWRPVNEVLGICIATKPFITTLANRKCKKFKAVGVGVLKVR